MSKPLVRLFIVGLSLSALATMASADTIVSAVSATTNMFEAYALVNAIDQAGLSPNYVSGVTGFNAYLAGNPVHTSVPGTDFIGQPPTGLVDFDLGSVMTVDAAAVWNFDGDPTAPIQNIHLYASLDSSFSTPIDLGAFILTNPPSDPVSAQVLSFGDVTAEFIRMDILSNYGDVTGSGLGQIAFDENTATTPEPATLLLLGPVLSGLALLRRRIK
jgi:hypothetical protein